MRSYERHLTELELHITRALKSGATNVQSPTHFEVTYFRRMACLPLIPANVEVVSPSFNTSLITNLVRSREGLSKASLRSSSTG